MQVITSHVCAERLPALRRIVPRLTTTTKMYRNTRTGLRTLTGSGFGDQTTHRGRFSRADRVNSRTIGKDVAMAPTDSDPEFDARLDDALRARHQAENLRRQAMAAGRAAAVSLQLSAESQERIAKSYERIAEQSDRGDRYREHAAIHRKFAQEDHRMAERMRKMTER
jgi:hypothetical protein